jgi:hypothetical protein
MTMRLTLRTLLAYLDDTLEPAEARLIGQKVAESETAQELIARIKEVTRRRRITTPAPGGPGEKVDPNNIAGYLDNALAPEALADVETLALASDVHLAEIAACHQILSIVLGEPAMVPPTAYQRMYALAKPPESNPQHQPPMPREPEDALTEGKEVDEALRLGLPAMHGGSSRSNRLILIGAAACVLLLLGVAIWQLLPSFARDGQGEDVASATDKPKRLLPSFGANKKNKAPAKTDAEATPKKEPDPKDKPGDKDTKIEDKAKLPEPKEIMPVEKEKKSDVAAPLNAAAVFIGQFEPPAPPGSAVLVQLVADKKQPERKQWTRLIRTKDPARVLSNAPLVSLPGYHSVVELDKGLRLTLWGNLPEIWRLPFALESVVTVHPSEDVDLDLTLGRGRIAIANPKDQPRTVRLRFENPSVANKTEVWDIKLLEKGTEVMVNLASFHLPGEQFFLNKDDPQRKGPAAGVVLVVLSGSAEVKLDNQPAEKLVPPPAGPILSWVSRLGKLTLHKADQMPPWTQPLPALAKDDPDSKARPAVLAALTSLNIDLSGQALETGLVKAAAANDIQKHRLVVRCAGALDDLQRVIEALEDKELEVRRAGVETLRIWIGASRDNDYKLFQQLQPTYSPDDARLIMTLLHRWSPEDDASPKLREMLVGNLTHKKVGIRELAHDYLLGLPGLGQAGSKIGFNATAPDFAQRAKEWQKLVQQGK